MSARARRRVTVLGNCVAHRLQFLLEAHPAFSERYELVHAPMIHTLRDPAEWDGLARAALACDIIFTQPLFSFGPCNTEALAAALPPERTLLTFSSPLFEAYFPDVIVLDGISDLKFSPILDWDSRIIFSCFVAGMSVFDVPAAYRRHALFRTEAMRRAVADALEACAARDQGVDLGVAAFVARHYAGTRLFESWRHPAPPLLARMLGDLGAALGLPLDPNHMALVPAHGFGFNQWPLLTTPHGLFHFPEQAFFRIGGREVSLEDAAMAYYNFYEFHPHVVERNLDKIVSL